jgi:outer membrane protein assembly factor BamA
MNRALDLFLNQERTGGIYPRFALGGALSSGIGFTAFNKNLFHQQKEVQLRYLLATRGNQTADFRYRDPSFLGSSFMFETDVFWLKFDNSYFYLGGNRAGENDQTKYALDQVSMNATLSHMVAPNLKASLLGRLLVTDAEPSSRLPSTPVTVPGINNDMQGVAVEPSLTYDSRDNQFRPSTGWFLDSGFTFTEQLNRDQFRYMGYWVDMQRYIPVFQGNRVLLVRAYLSKLDSLNGQSIPFYELNLLDVNNGLRGFDRGRWQDKGALLFNLEWRYPVWKDIEGTIFLDQGQVFGDYKDLQLKLFQYSAGAGFRFVTAQKFSFRMQVAASQDGVLTLLRADLEFFRRRGTILGGF